MLHKRVVKVLYTIFSYILLELSSYLNVSSIVGSRRLFFSAINCTGPLIGRFNGLGAFILVLLRRCFFSTNTVSFVLFNPLLYHIPTLIASTYWYSSSRFVRLGLPIILMGLFIMHPIGHQAFVYSLFWLIPMFIHLLRYQTPFTEALGTTFLAHGVGSVLQLYWAPMSTEYWIALLPLVVIERLLFASGMTLVYYGADWCIKMFSIYEYKAIELPRLPQVFNRLKA